LQLKFVSRSGRLRAGVDIGGPQGRIEPKVEVSERDRAIRTILCNTIWEEDAMQGTKAMTVICYRFEWTLPIPDGRREERKD
jgi:hypothetical protein